jgi:AcrR family transcriptional regulator
MAARKKPAAKYHHGDLRSALVATAWTVVARQGMEALSLRAVADELGVSHAAPAHHFKDKAALLDALRAEAWRRFADALEEKEGLRAVGRAYIGFAQAHPRQMRLMFGSGPHPTAEIATQGSRAWAALTAAVAKHVGPKRAADAKELSALSMAAWSAVHGFSALMSDAALPEGLQGSEPLRERVLDVVLGGLLTNARER